MYPLNTRRPRRNRKSEAVRSMVEETTLSVNDLIYPLFVKEGKSPEEVVSMPGIYRHTPDSLYKEVEESMNLGIRSFALFPNLPESLKDKMATESLNPDGLYLRMLRELKVRFPDMCLMTDVAMDPYSSDGHDGIYDNGEIVNDATLDVLAKMAIAQAQCGADIIGPSDMMDGRVGHLRAALDAKGFQQVSIISYSAKYASAFYGPFRDALDSAPKHGDKKTYQMNPANVREALVEGQLDYEEGADFLMVKPALSYLDVIKLMSENFPLPIAAYNVSGEYAMVKAAAQRGWVDGPKIMVEILTSIRRAGAKVILTYFAKEFAQLKKR